MLINVLPQFEDVLGHPPVATDIGCQHALQWEHLAHEPGIEFLVVGHSATSGLVAIVQRIKDSRVAVIGNAILLSGLILMAPQNTAHKHAASKRSLQWRNFDFEI